MNDGDTRIEAALGLLAVLVQQRFDDEAPAAIEYDGRGMILRDTSDMQSALSQLYVVRVREEGKGLLIELDNGTWIVCARPIVVFPPREA